MPERMHRLTPAEEADYIKRLQIMKAKGMDIEIPERWLERARCLDITILGLETEVFDLPSGLAAYQIYVRLVALRRFTLLDCEITTDWDDQIVLDGKSDDQRNCYWFGRQRYEPEQVLNPRLTCLRFHHRDQMVEGMILASGLKPIPVAYSQGMKVPFRLTFLDQSENPISHDGKLCVYRSTQRKKGVIRRTSGLRDGEYVPAWRPARIPVPQPDGKPEDDDHGKPDSSK
jgi:hypothetical protein